MKKHRWNLLAAAITLAGGAYLATPAPALGYQVCTDHQIEGAIDYAERNCPSGIYSFTIDCPSPGVTIVTDFVCYE